MHVFFPNKRSVLGYTTNNSIKSTGGNQAMAKAGMRRPSPKEPHGTESNHKTHIPKNDAPPVPELQGKAKAGHKKAKPM